MCNRPDEYLIMHESWNNLVKDIEEQIKKYKNNESH